MALRFPYRFFAVLLLAGALSACADKKEKDTYVEAPVEKLYNDATDAMLAEKYAQAQKLFDEVDRQHPYSAWAAKAELMSAYTQYQRNKYEETIAALDRFIQLHPGNRDAAYAYYLKALCYYEQIEDVKRDQQNTQLTLDALQEVIRRFPDSTYARDARVKLDLTRDHLAGKEMDVGRWYQAQGQFLAAVNRFRRVIDSYQVTTHVPEALQRLTECYLALGLKEEAQQSAAVLGYNFPGSRWYSDSYALLKGAGVAVPKQPDSDGWLSRTWKSIF